MDIQEVRSNLWVEKFAPQTLVDIILPERIKRIFVNLLAKKEIPNLLLTGSPGSGKTTVAKVFGKELKANVLFVNASKERGIDTIRSTIESFASTVSIDSDIQKIVILDEIDNMSRDAIMALRGFIERFSCNARFFLTCNYPGKLPEAIHSRMQTVDFLWTEEDRKTLMKEFASRILYILEYEHIKVEESGKKPLGEFIRKLFPDMRKIIGELQLFSQIDGTINEALLYMLDESAFDELYKSLKEKNFTKMREWVAKHVSTNADFFYAQILKDLEKVFVEKFIPEAITVIHEHMYKAAFIFSKETNVVCCCVYLMAQCEFK